MYCVILLTCTLANVFLSVFASQFLLGLDPKKYLGNQLAHFKSCTLKIIIVNMA